VRPLIGCHTGSGRTVNGGHEVESYVTFLDCPAYLDAHGSTRCGLPAEVEDRYTARSSDGPLECARIQCPRGHWFNGPLESLIWAVPRARTSPARDSSRPARGEAAR
jgi:hypothetical protein